MFQVQAVPTEELDHEKEKKTNTQAEQLKLTTR
jgi:hypothetical protein